MYITSILIYVYYNINENKLWTFHIERETYFHKRFFIRFAANEHSQQRETKVFHWEITTKLRIAFGAT